MSNYSEPAVGMVDGMRLGETGKSLKVVRRRHSCLEGTDCPAPQEGEVQEVVPGLVDCGD